MITAYLICFTLLAISFIVGITTQQVFLSRLRKIDRRVWESIGKTVVFLNSGLLNTIDLARFLWSRDYEKVPDQKTVALGRFLRGFYVFYFALLGLMILIFFIMKHQQFAAKTKR